MKSLYIDKQITYDGTQLSSLHAYLNYKILGPSIISWQGPCFVSLTHMVDGEDLLEESTIAGSLMVHFVVEVFDRDLFSGVVLQRLLASIVRDQLQAHTEKVLTRDGDDIYLDDRKLSISIATRSPISTMIHFAVNVSNEGTPVKTLALEDLKVDPKTFAEMIMQKFAQEYESITKATQKVKPVP